MPAGHPSARDRAAELLALAREIDGHAVISARPGQLDELEAIAARLHALAGVSDPGVTRVLALCDEVVAAREAGDVVAELDAREVRALLGHTTTDTEETRDVRP